MTLRRVTYIFTLATTCILNVFQTVPGGILKTLPLNVYVYEYYVLHCAPEYLGNGLARELLRIIWPRYYYPVDTSSEILHR